MLGSTVSEEMLSLVLGSRLGLGGGCLREVGLPSSSPPPPTECSDWERTAKPGPQEGCATRSGAAGIVMEPMRRCFPSVTMSSPVLKGQRFNMAWRELERTGETEKVK